MRNDKISIIIPAYNVSAYINRCVKSVVNQTYKNLEIIIVDDGSTDNTKEICDEWKLIDKRIIVFHTVNHGLSAARNFGLKKATGSFIGFVDGDDWCENDMFESLYKSIISDDFDMSICLANSVRDLKDVKKFKTSLLYGKNDIKIFEGSEQIFKAHLCKENLINAGVWNKLYKRELFYGLEFPVGKIHEDNFIMYKLLFRCEKVIKINLHKYNYFYNENGICHKKISMKNFDSIEANFERYCFVLNHFPLLEVLARSRLVDSYLNLFFRSLKEECYEKYKETFLKYGMRLKKMRIKDTDLTRKEKTGAFLAIRFPKIFKILVKILY